MAKEKKPGFFRKIKNGYDRMRYAMEPVDNALAAIGRALYSLRKIFMAIPVVLLAMKVFLYAKENLPQEVGVLLQESGDYLYILDKNAALSVCLAITGACLLLMFLSKKIMYPWVITVFTLVLPIFLVISNMFPV